MGRFADRDRRCCRGRRAPVRSGGRRPGGTPDPIFHTDDAGNTWVVAVISFGTKYCKGTSGAVRLDNTQARDFLRAYGVPLY